MFKSNDKVVKQKRLSENYQPVTAIWILFSIATIVFIGGPILSSYFFIWLNSTMHQCYEMIVDKIQKEKNNENCCGGASSNT
jgi:hypothetical protein